MSVSILLFFKLTILGNCSIKCLLIFSLKLTVLLSYRQRYIDILESNDEIERYALKLRTSYAEPF